jgi:virulence-associated protein VagC
MGVHETRTYRSGKGVALRLPDSFAVAAGETMLVEQDGDRLIVRRVRERSETARKLRSLLGVLDAIGRPAGPAAVAPDEGRAASH